MESGKTSIAKRRYRVTRKTKFKENVIKKKKE